MRVRVLFFSEFESKSGGGLLDHSSFQSVEFEMTRTQEFQQESLLDLLEKHGLQPHSGCRAGSCASCYVEILEGEEFLETQGALEKMTLEQMSESLNSEQKKSLDIFGKGRLACRCHLKADEATCHLKIRQPKIS